MANLAAAGDPAAAIQTYRNFRIRLQEALIAQPDEATTRLFHEIRASARDKAVLGAQSSVLGKEGPSQPSTEHRAPSTAVPHVLTPLIGREQEVAEVREQLRQHRLVTLTGGGGVGKTRLALEVAATAGEAFPSGAVWVELAPLADGALVLPALATALGLRETGSDDPAELKSRLIARLAEAGEERFDRDSGQRRWAERSERRSGESSRDAHASQPSFERPDPGEANPAGDGALAGLRLATALGWLWLCRGYLTEGLEWLEGMLTLGSQLPAAVRAPALHRAARLAEGRWEGERARTFLQAARQEYEQVLTLARRAGNRSDVTDTLQSLAAVTFQARDLDATWSYCVEARQLLEELGDPVGIARTLEWMAGVPVRRGDLRAARPLLEERLAICRKLGDPGLLVHALGGMGHLERNEGDYARAQALYRESLLLRRELGNLFTLAQSLEDLAVLAGRQGEAERAIRLLGAAESFCETLDARPPVADPAEYERTVAESRAVLGEEAFAAAWVEGRGMSLDDAIAFALEGSSFSPDGGE
jgi:tetratricopeptide (TPR) repeat protein